MQFNHIEISPEKLIEVARGYAGMKYNAHHTVENISTDCAGFFVLIALKVGLLNPLDTSALSPSSGEGRERFLAEMLHDNFNEIPLSESQPGDLLRFRFDDSPGRHIALKTSNNPAPNGSIIHAMNGRVSNTGKVFEQRIDAHIAQNLFKGYRLKQWAEF